MKLKKILLLMPPAYAVRFRRDINPLPPLSLGYLAAIAEQEGMEVRILDCLMKGWHYEEVVDRNTVRVGLSDADIRSRIAEFKPDLVGVTCPFSRQYQIYHRLFRLVKEIDPAIRVVAGGAHATVCPQEVLEDGHCDYVILGEAEESFAELIRALQRDEAVDAIDGLGWKDGGRLRLNPKNRLIRNLDSIPFPAYHLMELDGYFGLVASHGARHKKRFCPIITSRGCPARCTFCSAHQVWGKMYRTRSVENVIEELRLLKSRYGIEEILFEDDNVTADAKRAKTLFSRLIEERFDFVWDTPNGVGAWSMDEEMIDLMKASGCVKLNFPVESGSPRVLKEIIRKPLDLDKVRRLTTHCDRIGLAHDLFLVIGMPGERLSEMWESVRFAAECGCFSPHISVATPYPGTELYEECMNRHLFSRPFSMDDLFIRSFLVRTTEWNEKDLGRFLFQANWYLKLRGILKNPGRAIRYVKKIVSQPSRLIGVIRHGE